MKTADYSDSGRSDGESSNDGGDGEGANKCGRDSHDHSDFGNDFGDDRSRGCVTAVVTAVWLDVATGDTMTVTLQWQ